ncbi:MAG: gfo/Idh/MocA family oxidoreductase [Planctomycetota bacterium]|nr:MAG: gfo/Idh/MocA family oxidoreductase [Planctomycetota bacterium]
MKPLAAAVIGVGHLGRHHARILASLDEVKLLAVVDPDEKRGRQIAETNQTQWLAHRRDLPMDTLDFVVVATPTTRHLECAADFLHAGVACLIEKPLAPDLESCQKILQHARQGRALLGVGHVERFNPAVRRAMELGIRPRFVEAHRLAPYPFRSTDVGVVLDLMIHDLDLLLAWIGEDGLSVDQIQVDPVGGRVLSPSEDIVSVRLRFPNQVVANLTASRLSLKPMRRFRVFGPDCYVSVDSQDRYALLVKKAPGFDADAVAQASRSADPVSAFRGLLHTEELVLEEDEPLRAELQAFAEAVRNGGPAPVSGEDGARAVALAYRIMNALQDTLWEG